jgi:hypothetical protein
MQCQWQRALETQLLRASGGAEQGAPLFSTDCCNLSMSSNRARVSFSVWKMAGKVCLARCWRMHNKMQK